MTTTPDDWLDASFAAEWDRSSLDWNPIRATHLDVLVGAVRGLGGSGGTVLDLGVGSGRVAERLLAEAGVGRLEGYDLSPAMLDLARSRLAPFGDRVALHQADLIDLASREPTGPPAAGVIAVQTLHNLRHDAQQDVLHWARRALSRDGFLLVMDRVAVPSASLFPAFRAVWQLDPDPGPRPPAATHAEYVERLSTKGDRPVALLTLARWMQGSGFEVGVVHVVADRVVVVGIAV